MRARDDHGLRRFSHVSTVAVAGHRANEVVQEDSSIDWNRSDYDPYARTKKFCEHMVRRAAAGRAAHDFPSQHRSGRQPPPGNEPIRHGPRVCFSGRPSGASLPPHRQNRHRPRGFRRRTPSRRCTRRRIRRTRFIISRPASVRKRFPQLTDCAREGAGQARRRCSCPASKDLRRRWSMRWRAARERSAGWRRC